MFRIGGGFQGSPDTITTTANQNLIPDKTTFYKFQFKNTQACHVKINGSNNAIYIPAGQGFNTEVYDEIINSFVVVDSGITCSWIGYTLA